MVETSTSTNRQNSDVQDNCNSDGLSIEEEQFFVKVKITLDEMICEPSLKALTNVLTYSRSL